jgi:outer membrane protein OmpA-like peptidoglycan-associated protein
MSSRSERGVSGHLPKVQGALAVLLLLAGCSAPRSMNPVDWWHDLEGGAIAEARPPPPNADAPYPNLGTVPPRPPPPDVKGFGRIAGALVADRANAQYAAIAEPIPSLTPAAPRPPPPAAPPGAGEDQPSAALPAATAPPPPPPQPVPPSPPPRPAPVAAVAATPLAPMVPPAAMPEPAAAPPSPAALPGLEVPAVTAPTPPPVPPPVPPAPPPPPGPPFAIPFPVGSAILPPSARPAINRFAAARGARMIAVTGFGEARSTDPAAQSAALPLALDRARAVANVLRAAGVPDAAIRIAAEPQGFGASARLVN